jgi:hypothetical protein
MQEKRFRTAKLIVLCFFATVLSFAFNQFCLYVLRIPLYLDTIFAAAVTFAVGLVPGLVVAILSLLIVSIYYNDFTMFFLCAIAEILLIWRLKPAAPKTPSHAKTDSIIASYAGVFARLMVLYIACAITVSIIGGVIDFLSYTVFGMEKTFFSAEDTFKLGLIRQNIHILGVNILSRIPVNIVDRFIVIFGGYGISILLRKTNLISKAS